MIDAAAARITIRTKGPAFAADISVNFVLPFLIYSYAAPLRRRAGATLFFRTDILWSIAEFIRYRRLDALSLVVLSGIILSLLAFFGGGGPRMLQLREKPVTGVIGIIFLVSGAIGRSLIYGLARAGMARSGSAEAERMRSLRNDCRFRRSMTIHDRGADLLV